MKLRDQIIRLAHENPGMRKHLLPLLKEASVPKEALAKDTEEFIAWVLASNKTIPIDSFRNFVERVTGWEPEQPGMGAPKKTGALAEGEKVLVDKYQNTNPLNVDEAEQYHGRVGYIKNRTDTGLVVQFYKPDSDVVDSGVIAVFDGFVSGKATGLYRWTPKADIQEGAHGALVEIVYLKGGQTPPPQRDMDALQKYIETGLARGEQRSEVYYTGYIAKFAYSKEGKLYIMLSAHQRDRPTTLSVEKGRVLYIGLAGRRPGGWKADWEQMNAPAAREVAASKKRAS